MLRRWWGLWTAALWLSLGPAGIADASGVPPEVVLPDLAATDAVVADQIRERYDVLRVRLSDTTATGREVAQAFGDLGAVYRAYRFHDRARASYSEAAARDPEEFRWRYMLGHLAREHGDFEASDRSFEAALELRSTDVPTRVWLGENALDTGRLDAAEAHFAEAVRRRPSCAKARLGLGRVALERGTPEEALAPLESALELQEDATEIHYALGLAHSRSGDPEAAQSHFARIPTDDMARVQIAFDDPVMQEVKGLRSSAQTFALKAQKAIAAQRFDEAISLLERAVEIDPDRSDTRYNLGATFLLVGRYEEARQQLVALLTAHPDYVQGYLLLSRLYLTVGDLARAEDLLLRAQAIDPAVAAGPLAEVRRMREGG